MERTWQNRRLTGADHPPYVRIGRRIIYHGDDVKAWLRSKVTNAVDGIKPRVKGEGGGVTRPRGWLDDRHPHNETLHLVEQIKGVLEEAPSTSR